AALVAAPAVLAKATEDDVAKVKVGMSRDEVVQIMGKPDKDQKVEEAELCRLLVYRSVGRYKIVNVWFDCSDKVKAVDKVSG
ncbi:MAG: outer membrane protein assembly factor BamE domain-containing protein, partial [Candidatus Binatia bacterium]